MTSASRGSPPPFSMGFPIDAGTAIENIFSLLSPSQNSRIFLIDGAGYLLASNQNTSIANDDGTSFVESISASDLVISQISQEIKTRSGSFSDMSRVVGTRFQPSFNGDSWAVSVGQLYLPATDNMYLAVAIPRRDFFGSIDDAQRTSIIVTIIFAALMILSAILVVIGVTVPIRKITIEMEKVAGFDFSLLREGFFVEDSVITELRNAQIAFNTLVKALTGALSRNKATAQTSSSVY
ncbi:hypothetical protein BJ742DRAFT_239602 [Cladochytrium replicatum]|nr:hypothetical protein BJ742DRAFT_239602 [Cladochytrium replicatum]